MSKKKILIFLVAVTMAFTSVFYVGTGEAFAVETEVGSTANIKYPNRDYALKIMLDAGHYGSRYNKGAISGYYESNAVWTITEEMEKVFSEYYDVKVAKTRNDKSKDLDVVTRGRKAKGYDLFVSNHTNSVDVASVDHPLVIIPFESKFYSKMYSLGSKIGKNIENIIGTKQSYKIRTETYGSGSYKKNSFGVIRGASEVGVPGIIVEHSFHSNKTVCRWLMSDTNLKKLARKNAETIAAFYGAKKSSNVTASFTVETTEKKSNIIAIPKSSTKYSYEVYYGLEGQTLKKLKTIKGTGGKITCEHKYPYKGKTVYYVVRPVSSTEVGKYSKAKGALIKDIGSTTLTAEPYDQGVVKLSWTKADSAEKYIITKKCEDELLWKKTVNPWVNHCYDTEVEDGKTYTYQVIVWGTDGVNEYTKYSYKKSVTASVNLEPVKVKAVSEAPKKIKLTWDKNPSATCYYVYRSESKEGKYTYLKVTTGCTFTNTDLEENKKYFYKVKAVKNLKEYGADKKLYSQLSEPVSATAMIAPPAKVSGLTLSTTSGKVTAKWKKVAEAAGYKVAYKVKGGSYKYATTTNLSRSITGLKKGKVYQVKVRGYKKTGTKTTYGSWSDLKSITCK